MDVELSQAEKERYAKQMALPEFGLRAQERLKQSRALVVGAGAIGATAAAQLASAGVGYLGIVDGALLERSDLAGQSVHMTPDLGASKAESVAAKLGIANPEVQVDSYPVDMAEDNVEPIVAGQDLVLMAIGDIETRLLANDACVGAELLLVDCVARGSIGAVQIVRSDETACLRCQPPTELGAHGALTGLAGVIGSLGALEAVKLLAGLGSALDGRLVFDAELGRFDSEAVERNPHCPACAALAAAGAGGRAL